jgi:hypothetical protein
MTEKLTVGQEVYVSRARGGGGGIVTRVGRKYLTVACRTRGGDREEIDFDIETWQPRRDHVGPQPRLMSAEDGENWRRRNAAQDALHAAGVTLRPPHALTLEQIEAMAAIVSVPWDADMSDEDS